MFNFSRFEKEVNGEKSFNFVLFKLISFSFKLYFFDKINLAVFWASVLFPNSEAQSYKV